MIGWIKRLARQGKPTPGQRAAEGALERAISAREEAEKRRPMVLAQAARIRREREANHFASRIRMALEGEVP
ncbi:DUF7620 family protein [Streptomyces lavendofoliae]|uniref:Uncharacterized protein n=1 Tax=Streptomyces lavendofoliae TaxID=67314 RepID=A0A918I337_9ACTN|nr:hypothetical protein [Streptomyces lavendofoliae]GGU61819.1 hypothetical protein GCM10010274_58230 [Streptomyces lavendofoliae]